MLTFIGLGSSNLDILTFSKTLLFMTFLINSCRKCGGCAAVKIDRTGSTALHWAIDGANLDVIRWMLQDGCRVDVKDGTSGDSGTVVRHAGSG